jgi:uncharacterized oxidoreductase
LRIQADNLRRLIADIFHQAGCSAEESARIGKYLVGANLAGHDSHGVQRTQRYIEWLQEGKFVAGQNIEIITENDVMAVVDGGHGFGQTIGPQAVQLGIDKAAKNGIAIIALRRSGHLGRIGDWPEMAAAANQVSIHFVNVAGSQLVAPFGGTGRRMSTNPVAIGLPLPGEEPLILDFATSLVAEGKVLVAHNGGKPLPPGSLINPDGTLSTDPYTLYGETDPGRSPNPRNGPGAIRTMGEHKGSGLSFMCEMLAGALTGSGCAGPEQRQVVNGMLSIYMAMEFFDADQHFAAEARQYIEFFKSSPPATPGGEVLIPGEVERRLRAQRLANGIELPDNAWRSIVLTAQKVGLNQQHIDAAVAD